MEIQAGAWGQAVTHTGVVVKAMGKDDISKGGVMKRQKVMTE